MGVTIVKKTAGVAVPISAAGARVMGIDPSTYTGIAVVDGADVVRTEVIHFEGALGYARLQSIAKGVLDVVIETQPKFIFIERPITSGRFNHQIQQQIAVLIRDRLYTAGRPWFDVSPTTLKKWAAGTGKAKKKQMKEAVQLRWGFTNKSDDIVDAFALAKLGQVAVMQTVLMKGVQLGDTGVVSAAS